MKLGTLTEFSDAPQSIVMWNFLPFMRFLRAVAELIFFRKVVCHWFTNLVGINGYVIHGSSYCSCNITVWSNKLHVSCSTLLQTWGRCCERFWFRWTYLGGQASFQLQKSFIFLQNNHTYMVLGSYLVRYSRHQSYSCFVLIFPRKGRDSNCHHHLPVEYWAHRAQSLNWRLQFSNVISHFLSFCQQNVQKSLKWTKFVNHGFPAYLDWGFPQAS